MPWLPWPPQSSNTEWKHQFAANAEIKIDVGPGFTGEYTVVGSPKLNISVSISFYRADRISKSRRQLTFF
jgi:hypothetical protein